MTTPQKSIAEQVKFWEEQDKINQVLVPRVLRHHELLSEHIREHENLPTFVAEAANTASQTVQNRFNCSVTQALNQHSNTIKEAADQAIAQFEAKHQTQLDRQRQEYNTAQQKQQAAFDRAVKDLQTQLPDLAQRRRHTLFHQTWIYRVKEAILHDNVVVNTTTFLTLAYPHSEGGYMLLARYIFKERVKEAHAEGHAKGIATGQTQGKAQAFSEAEAWFQQHQANPDSAPPPWSVNGNNNGQAS